MRPLLSTLWLGSALLTALSQPVLAQSFSGNQGAPVQFYGGDDLLIEQGGVPVFDRDGAVRVAGAAGGMQQPMRAPAYGTPMMAPMPMSGGVQVQPLPQMQMPMQQMQPMQPAQPMRAPVVSADDPSFYKENYGQEPVLRAPPPLPAPQVIYQQVPVAVPTYVPIPVPVAPVPRRVARPRNTCCRTYAYAAMPTYRAPQVCCGQGGGAIVQAPGAYWQPELQYQSAPVTAVTVQPGPVYLPPDRAPVPGAQVEVITSGYAPTYDPVTIQPAAPAYVPGMAMGLSAIGYQQAPVEDGTGIVVDKRRVEDFSLGGRQVYRYSIQIPQGRLALLSTDLPPIVGDCVRFEAGGSLSARLTRTRAQFCPSEQGANTQVLATPTQMRASAAVPVSYQPHFGYASQAGCARAVSTALTVPDRSLALQQASYICAISPGDAEFGMRDRMRVRSTY